MEELSPKLRDGVSPINSIDNLCQALGITHIELQSALALTTEQRYLPIKLLKKNGTTRTVYDPHKDLRRIQRRIKNRILSELIVYPKYLYGSLSDKEHPRDYVRCAAIHCEAKALVKADISNFFDSIRRDAVFEVFSRIFKYSSEVSEILADLCTRDGVVPQGAATSSFLANLCLFDEADLVRKLGYEKLKYTRLIDDITVSTTSSEKKMDRIYNDIKKFIENSGYQMNEDKSGIESLSTKPLTVHGLRVNQKIPALPRDEVRKIRAEVHNLEKKSKIPNARVSFDYRRIHESASGKVNKLKRLNHPRHTKLRQKLKEIAPLPSKKDIKRCQIMLARLNRDYRERGNTHHYKVRFYRLRHRLGILRRIYHREAAILRTALKTIAPGFADAD